MDTFASPVYGATRPTNGMARALRADQRRTSMHDLQRPGGHVSRHSMEPVVPGLGERADEPERLLRRLSWHSRGVSQSSFPGLAGELIPPTPHGAGSGQATDSAISPRGSARSKRPDEGPSKQWELAQILLAPNLREDYYSTLMASSVSAHGADSSESMHPDRVPANPLDNSFVSPNKLGEVVLADASAVYRRTPQRQLEEARHGAQGKVTVIAVTRLGICVVGDEHGYLTTFDMVSNPPEHVAQQSWTEVIGPARDMSAASMFVPRYITHAVWSDLSPERVTGECYTRLGCRVELVVGTSDGGIFKLQLNNQRRFELAAEIPRDEYHRGICSMTFDARQRVLVVSGTDRDVSVWAHSTYAERAGVLVLQHRFSQPSAIKGMEFCPGLRALVALGGGRRDRTLRFYDTERQKMESQVSMPGQIVGVIWLSRWEVFVAIGHSRVRRYSGFGKVYNLATNEIVCDIPGDGYVLCAVKTQRGFSVYTSERILFEFSWRPESSPPTSAAALHLLRCSFPLSPLR